MLHSASPTHSLPRDEVCMKISIQIASVHISSSNGLAKVSRCCAVVCLWSYRKANSIYGSSDNTQKQQEDYFVGFHLEVHEYAGLKKQATSPGVKPLHADRAHRSTPFVQIQLLWRFHGGKLSSRAFPSIGGDFCLWQGHCSIFSQRVSCVSCHVSCHVTARQPIHRWLCCSKHRAGQLCTQNTRPP